jgi:hypothetical protein
MLMDISSFNAAWLSDRRNSSQQPFDPARTDKSTIDISPTGMLTMHSQTWNTTTTVQLQCYGDVFYGWVPAQHLYVIVTLKRVTRPD